MLGTEAKRAQELRPFFDRLLNLRHLKRMMDSRRLHVFNIQGSRMVDQFLTQSSGHVSLWTPFRWFKVKRRGGQANFLVTPAKTLPGRFRGRLGKPSHCAGVRAYKHSYPQENSLKLQVIFDIWQALRANFNFDVEPSKKLVLIGKPQILQSWRYICLVDSWAKPGRLRLARCWRLLTNVIHRVSHSK